MKPPMLTPALEARVVQYVRAGVPLDTAVAAVGVPPSVFATWMERGARARRGRLRDLHAAVTRAEAAFEAELVADLYAAAQKDDKLGIAYLERRHIEQYGRQRLLGKVGGEAVTVTPQRLLLPEEEPLRTVQPRRRPND